MKSAVAITAEIDDLKLAASELSAQIGEKLSLQKNSIGIAYCDADMDIAGLGELLRARLGMDIVGLTTTATVERRNGYNDMGVVLTVLTADDVSFAVGCTGDLDNDGFPGVIRAAYSEARGKLPGDPRLILTFAPYVAEITSENYIEVLNGASAGAPVFGGVATDHYNLQDQKTFFNGQAFSRGLVFLLLSGNVKPAFAMEHRFSKIVEKKGVITKASGNLVEKVGGQTFKEFVSTMVPVPDDVSVIYHFQSTPFVMELPDHEKEEQPVVRALCTMDHTTGAGGFLSKMPEGSRIYLNVLQRDNLRESCRDSMAKLIGLMAENKDYKYSMIFISTCNARHLLMGGDKKLESGIITEMLRDFPPDLNAAGLYAFGEMCPTGQNSDGTAKNRFHNISFALCAI